MLEVADPKKTTSDYLSKCDGRFSWSNLTAEEKNATIGMRATNDPAEIEFSTFTKVRLEVELALIWHLGLARYVTTMILDVVKRNT